MLRGQAVRAGGQAVVGQVLEGEHLGRRVVRVDGQRPCLVEEFTGALVVAGGVEHDRQIEQGDGLADHVARLRGQGGGLFQVDEGFRVPAVHVQHPAEQGVGTRPGVGVRLVAGGHQGAFEERDPAVPDPPEDQRPLEQRQPPGAVVQSGVGGGLDGALQRGPLGLVPGERGGPVLELPDRGRPSGAGGQGAARLAARLGGGPGGERGVQVVVEEPGQPLGVGLRGECAGVEPYEVVQRVAAGRRLGDQVGGGEQVQGGCGLLGEVPASAPAV